MRVQRWGKVVNLSSIGGLLVLPGGAFYHATKFGDTLVAWIEVLAPRSGVRGYAAFTILTAQAQLSVLEASR